MLFTVDVETKNGSFKFCPDVKSIKMRFSMKINCEDYVEMRNKNDFFEKWERSLVINEGEFNLMALTLIIAIVVCSHEESFSCH